MHTHSYKSIHNTLWQSSAEQYVCTSPVLASPLVLHSREQMFGDSLQPQRISVYKANSSTQHFWLQWEICSWNGGEGRPLSQCKVSWGWEERGKEWEGGGTQRWNCVKVTSLLHRKNPCFQRLRVHCVSVFGDGIVYSIYSISQWHHAASGKSNKVALLHIWLYGVYVTSPRLLCLFTSLDCPLKSCRQAQSEGRKNEGNNAISLYKDCWYCIWNTSYNTGPDMLMMPLI